MAAGSSSTLIDLLEQANKLSTELLQPMLPHIQLSLEGLYSEAGGMAKNPMAPGDIKAHYLLAGCGINPDETQRLVNSLTLYATTAADAQGTISDTDLKGYLRYKRERNLIAAFQESSARAQIDFEAFLARHLDMNWAKQKQLIFDQFRKRNGNTNPENGVKIITSNTVAVSVYGSSLEWTNLFEIEGFMRGAEVEGSTAYHTKQVRFAEVVTQLNNTRSLRASGQQTPPIDIVMQFAGVLTSLGIDGRTRQIYDGFRLVSSIVSRALRQQQNPERSLVESYITAGPESRLTRTLEGRLIQGARAFLETQFYSLVEAEIGRHPQEAQLGGVPSVLQKIRAYLNVRFYRNGRWTNDNLELVNNVPVWALLFYLIRSGHAQDAADYVALHESSFAKVEPYLPSYIKAYVADESRSLPRQLRDRLHAEYNQRIRYASDTLDPYKLAIYKILGRCELSKRSLPTILPLAEDYMWLQLVLIRQKPAEDLSDVETYSLQDLQRTIIQFGPRHFNPRGSNPGVYFLMLLLSCQFERAIHYLYIYLPIEATHFAIALAYYGLLRIFSEAEPAETDLLIVERVSAVTEIGNLNFARLIGQYAKQITKLSSITAAEYLYLISLNADLPKPTGVEQRDLCHNAINDLILQSRDFPRLLGDIKTNGTRESGAIEHRINLLHLPNEGEYLTRITERAAKQADSMGRISDAVLLYHLSGSYDVVVSLINRSIGDLLSDPAYTNPDPPANGKQTNISLTAVENPAQLARDMISVYARNASIFQTVSQHNRDTCDILLGMVDAKRYYSRQLWDRFIQALEQLNIIPVSSSMDVGTVRRLAHDFGRLDGAIAKNIPDFLVMTLQGLLHIYQSMTDSPYEDLSRNSKMSAIRRSSRNIMVYAGMIQFKLPSEVYMQLNTLSTKM